jgi:hypothetical protein
VPGASGGVIGEQDDQRTDALAPGPDEVDGDALQARLP